MNSFVLNVLNLTLCPDHVRSGSSALSVINGPTILAPGLAIYIRRKRNFDVHNDDFLSDN